jgi:hypothetical protein
LRCLRPLRSNPPVHSRLQWRRFSVGPQPKRRRSSAFATGPTPQMRRCSPRHRLCSRSALQQVVASVSDPANRAPGRPGAIVSRSAALEFRVQAVELSRYRRPAPGKDRCLAVGLQTEGAAVRLGSRAAAGMPLAPERGLPQPGLQPGRACCGMWRVAASRMLRPPPPAR